jgi:glycosyltransferase involved in cell wall biosynthesis
MSRVDVIVPCYKYAHYLRGCVESVLSQDGVDVRVLIIDDASPDDTAKVGAALATEDSRVELLRHAVNRGHVATYNEGLEWVRGDYLLLLSADDLLTPGALSRAARLLDARPDVGMVCGQEIRLFGDEDLPDAQTAGDDYEERVIPGLEFLEISCHTVANHVSTPTAVVRAELQEKVGGYRRDFPHTCDMEMWLRIAAHAPIGYLDVPQGYYRLHGRNMSSTIVANAVADLRQKEATFRVLFQEYGKTHPGLERLQQLAAASMAREVRRAAEEMFWEASRAFDEGDVDACNRLLREAGAACPELKSGPAWRRVRVKQFLGPRIWSVVRFMVGRGGARDPSGERAQQRIAGNVPVLRAGQILRPWRDR